MKDVGKLVVARFPDGRIVTGRLEEFRTENETFRVANDLYEWVTIQTQSLKALFFVRSLQGNPSHRKTRVFPDHSAGGIKTWIEFRDGEEMAGWQISLRPMDDGIFLFPTDSGGNIEKVYAPRNSLRRVLQGEAAEKAAQDYQDHRPPGGDIIRPECWEDVLRAR